MTTIRPATPADAARCAEVHHTCWVETYADMLPDDYFETVTLRSRTERWRAWLEGGMAVVVAEVAGDVVGFAYAGRSRRQGDHDPVRDRELWMIFVLPSQHGTGVAQQLLDTVLPRDVPAELWMAEENQRARRFYERNGFVSDGTRFVDEHLPALRELRMVR